jgi:hypothetical protein
MRASFPFLLSLALVAGGLGGCNDGGTEVMFLVDAAAGSAGGSGPVEILLFDSKHRLADHRVDDASLPGAVVVSSLPAPATLRVVIRAGSDLVGATTFDTKKGQRVQVRLTLARDLADGDSDGIPDSVDDCPGVADPLQEDADGTLPGDACADLPDGGSPACLTSYALCEDFEAASLDGTRWRTNNDHGASSLDTTEHHGGNQALRSSNDALAMATFGAAAIFETETLPALKDMHIRAFVRVPAGFPGAPTALIKVQQTADPHHGVTLQLDSGGFSIYNDLPATSTFQKPARPFPYDQWFCVEWQIQLGSPTGTSRVFIDGSEVGELNAAQDTSATGIDQVSFGMVVYAPAAVDARKIWIDDIAIAAAPIGCR